MRVAVVGTGRIGGTLGRAFAAAGHEVTFGSRGAETDAVVGGTSARVASIGDAVESAEVVVVAVPGDAVDEFVAAHGQRLGGRLVLDATNRVGAPVAHSARLYGALPGVRYARAFNCLGVENLADSQYADGPADMFFSAPEGADRATVEELISAVGLRAVYVGDGQADVVDGVLRLWFALAIGQRRGRQLAFRTLER
jgi:8-hydroxy-5-deazaflavin:NADPH oxidoreductase